MKVRASVKKICTSASEPSRGVVRVICTNPKHKQARDRKVLAHSYQF